MFFLTLCTNQEGEIVFIFMLSFVELKVVRCKRQTCRLNILLDLYLTFHENDHLIWLMCSFISSTHKGRKSEVGV